MGASLGAVKSVYPQTVGLSDKKRLFAEEYLSCGGFAPSSMLSYPENYIIVPGLCDVHVHFREPGFSYKETILSGSLAAKNGGYTTVCTMPNLNPVPDSLESLRVQLDIIEKTAAVRVIPYGAITVGEKGESLSDMEAMSPYVCAFSDDGHGVQNGDMMEAAMRMAKTLGKIIAAHCEDNSLLSGGYIHDGVYCREHNHRGISSASEYKQIERDIELAEKTGASYHVCHISTKESVQLIREAKRRGVDVSCETAPHYLVLCDEDLQEDGRFKMNPPLRSRADKEALIEGILDGTIDMIATDHAPHSTEEKSRGLEKSAMGIVGLETAFPILYTELVKPGIITIEKLVEMMSINPRKRFGINEDPGFALFEIATPYTVNPAEFKTMGRATPFEGREVYGRCVLARTFQSQAD
ncbi:MAG: dihydroorotase [Oscillospiraceae bacterium]|nr:dihydroorotase [Oscillospiraceae bacterium]